MNDDAIHSKCMVGTAVFIMNMINLNKKIFPNIVFLLCKSCTWKLVPKRTANYYMNKHRICCTGLFANNSLNFGTTLCSLLILSLISNGIFLKRLKSANIIKTIQPRL